MSKQSLVASRVSQQCHNSHCTPAALSNSHCHDLAVQVTPIDLVPTCFIPALFGHATEDTFIRIHHSERLHNAYIGDKNLIKYVLWFGFSTWTCLLHEQCLPGDDFTELGCSKVQHCGVDEQCVTGCAR